MLTVAYLSNLFPAAVEPYVLDEIQELRSRGVRVVSASVLKLRREDAGLTSPPDIVLRPLSGIAVLQAIWMCIRRWNRISGLVLRALFGGREGPVRRLKALLHTLLGAMYALRLEPYRAEHIHVHHGYYGAWVGMAAARLLNIGFSLTLHGSDLLLHGAYLDVKLENCAFCLTVSEYNRRFILKRYPRIAPTKVLVARLGVDVDESTGETSPSQKPKGDPLVLLAVGRLQPVKDHAFLVRACAELRARGVWFECSIAGDGPERRHLESLIRKHALESRVTLLGHVARQQMNSLYNRADVVVLTSRSEGLPLVLMEAMAKGKIVLAPAITGIPELVIERKTGYLYEPGSVADFVARLRFIHSLIKAERADPSHLASTSRTLDWMRHAARVQIRHNFNRKQNLESFGDLFIRRIAPQAESIPNENLVLQQI